MTKDDEKAGPLPETTMRRRKPEAAARDLGLRRLIDDDPPAPPEPVPSVIPDPIEPRRRTCVIADRHLTPLRSIAATIGERHTAIGQLEEQRRALGRQIDELCAGVLELRRRFDGWEEIARSEAGAPAHAELDLDAGEYVLKGPTT